MKTIVILAVCVALSGCAGLSGLTSPERSTAQRQADRETLALLLQHCDLTANFDMELGLSARSGVGLKAGGTCRPGVVVPLKQFGTAGSESEPPI